MKTTPTTTLAKMLLYVTYEPSYIMVLKATDEGMEGGEMAKCRFAVMQLTVAQPGNK